jgi:hypothetical protein
MASGAKRAGTKMMLAFAPVVSRLFDRVEDRNFALDPFAALAGGDAGDDIGAVGQHLLGVEESFAAGDALHHQAGVFIYEDAHA